VIVIDIVRGKAEGNGGKVCFSHIDKGFQIFQYHHLPSSSQLKASFVEGNTETLTAEPIISEYVSKILQISS
jgi:hypothetical protein